MLSYDYIITNRCLQLLEILDIRTLNSANIGSDHKLHLGKIKIKANKVIRSSIQGEKINVESLWNKYIKELYQKRLKEKIKNKPINEEDDINNSWEKLKKKINEAATEALGSRKTNHGKAGPNKTPWFCRDVKEQCRKKKLFCVNFIKITAHIKSMVL